MSSFWQTFASHRTNVTNLLTHNSGAGNGRICILGAGCCNDLDLHHLVAAHREVHLVDLDADAIVRGLRWQGLENYPSVCCHGGIDVTGTYDTIAAWSPLTVVQREQLTACVEAPQNRTLTRLPGPFDIVASTCILSQLMRTVVRSVSQEHPCFAPLLQAIRTGHLRLLVRLIAPGGIGLLITDVLSSEFYPELASVAHEDLSSLISQLVQERKFFSGVNPAAIRRDFRTDAVLSSELAEVIPLAPWLWDTGPWVYVVVGWKLRRKL